MKEPRYTLVDGEERNRARPTTFEIPPVEARTSLKVGDFAKCMFEWRSDDKPERMWIIVREVKENGTYLGELNNHPVSRLATLGDAVEFAPRHVIDIGVFN